MKNFTRQRPVLAFIIYAFVITWILGVITGIVIGPLETKLGLKNRPVSMILFKFGPSLAGLLAISLKSGNTGLSDLLKRGMKWRTPTSVIAVAVFVPAVLMALLLLLWSPENISEIISWSAISILLPAVVAKIFFGGGFGEEFGWRGFMLPQLEKKYSPLAASMIIGVIWIAWHLPATVLGGDVGNPAIFATTIMGYSVILTWIYHNSDGSVLWAAIFHGWANALSNTYDKILGKQIADIELYLNGSYAGAITAVAGTLLLIYGKKLGQKNLSPTAHKINSRT